MTFSDQAADLRARKQTLNTYPAQRPASGNAPARPPLRLIKAPTQTADTPPPPPGDHGASAGHVADLEDATTGHTVVATHPPTLGDAASNLWQDRNDVRHGLVGQLAAAAAGLLQLAGLAVCWGLARVFFSTKTRAALFALVVTCGVVVYAAASHA